MNRTRRYIDATVAEVNPIDRLAGRQRQFVTGAFAGEGLLETVRDDLADDVPAGRQVFEPVRAGLVDVGVRVVRHADHARLTIVELTVVIQIGVDRNARQPRLAGIVLAVSVQVVPLTAVNRAGLDRDDAIAEVNAIDHDEFFHFDLVNAVGRKRLLPARRQHFDHRVGTRRQKKCVMPALNGQRRLFGLRIEAAVLVGVEEDPHVGQPRLVGATLAVTIGVEPFHALDHPVGGQQPSRFERLDGQTSVAEGHCMLVSLDPTIDTTLREQQHVFLPARWTSDIWRVRLVTFGERRPLCRR